MFIGKYAATQENQASGFPSRSDTNQPVQSQKQARLLKFGLHIEEELHYLCSENKGADQLRSYCEADLPLCFHIGQNPVFSRCGSNTGGSSYVFVAIGLIDSASKCCSHSQTLQY